jgi:hypothetical protein
MTEPETTDPETLAILSDPEAMRQIAESEAEIAQGLVETEAQLAEAMQRRLARK